MNKQILTRNECNALRGLAIIGIFLHNYCHWLGPIVKENEYQYFQKNIDALNVALSHPDQNLVM
ncbi:MAG: acyltransferase, partial [Prevotella sp.]|nr:acyltransferase [Prevotella sp.]